MLISFSISLIGLALLLLNCILFNKTSKGKDTSYSIFRVYITLLFLIELLCNIMGILKPYSNLFLSHYYFIIQFVVLSFFFYNLFTNKFLKKMIVFFLVAVLVFLGNQYHETPSLYWNFNLFEIGVTSFLLMIYASIHLISHSQHYFNFCLGLIFYLACSSYIFLSGNTDLVIFTEPFFFDLWVFNSLFYIFYQVMIYKEWKFLNAK